MARSIDRGGTSIAKAPLAGTRKAILQSRGEKGRVDHTSLPEWLM